MVLHVFAFTYSKPLFLLLRGIILLFTEFNRKEKRRRGGLETLQQSFFLQPDHHPCALPHSSPAGCPAPRHPVQPSSFIFHAHFLLWSQSYKRRAHWISNFSSWRTVHPASSQLPPADSSVALGVSVSSLALITAVKSNLLGLGTVNTLHLIVLCCGVLSYTLWMSGSILGLTHSMPVAPPSSCGNPNCPL